MFTTKIPSNFMKEIRKKIISYSFIPNPHPHPHPHTSHKTSTTKKSHQFTSLSSQLRRNRRSSNHRLIPRALLLRPRQRHIILQRKFRLGIPLSRFKFHHQRIFDGKYRIIFQVFGFGIENLRCDGFVAFVLHNVVDVCGAEWVAVHEFEEFTRGAVVGDLGRGCVSVFIDICYYSFYYYFLNLFLVLSYSFLFFLIFIFTISLLFLCIDTNREMKTYWIWSWSEAVKGIFTLCSGIELSTEVVIVLRIILLLVKSYNTISLSAEVDGKRE